MLLEQRVAVKAANLHLWKLFSFFLLEREPQNVDEPKHRKTMALTFRRAGVGGVYFRGIHPAITISPISLCITCQCTEHVNS